MPQCALACVQLDLKLGGIIHALLCGGSVLVGALLLHAQPIGVRRYLCGQSVQALWCVHERVSPMEESNSVNGIVEMRQMASQHCLICKSQLQNASGILDPKRSF